jgi:hypothetical protein
MQMNMSHFTWSRIDLDQGSQDEQSTRLRQRKEAGPMKTNELPHFDNSINTTGCCPKFNTEGWDAQDLHFRRKKFAHATTRSAMHIPLNMGNVFARVQGKIEKANAQSVDNTIVLSHETSPWKADHYFAVDSDIEGEEMTTLSGDYITKVFEGPYSNMKGWHEEMLALAKSKQAEDKAVYFFYTTCPKCAKAYGKNYVVGVAEV